MDNSVIKSILRFFGLIFQLIGFGCQANHVDNSYVVECLTVSLVFWIVSTFFEQ